MYDTHLYKSVAKKQLAKRWGIPVLATFITAVVMCVVEGAIKKSESIANGFLGVPYFMLLVFYLCLYGCFLVANGNMYMYLFKTKERFSFSQYIDGFGLCVKGILLTLWSSFWLFLWSLLFLIPGVIKSLAYSLAIYVVLENPRISVKKALKISIIMTRGYKTDMFFTALSFLPWFLLSILTFGVGFLWLVPYMNMTWVDVYYALKQQAIKSGTLQIADFE